METKIMAEKLKKAAASRKLWIYGAVILACVLFLPHMFGSKDDVTYITEDVKRQNILR